MKNKIVCINEKDFEKVRKEIYSVGDIFCVEIDGKECTNLSDYLSDISNKLGFPTMAKNFDGYDDWMTDLTWINKDSIVIIINSYTEFMRTDEYSKEKIMELFRKSILPWWEREVCKYVVGAKTKVFTIYLIN